MAAAQTFQRVDIWNEGFYSNVLKLRTLGYPKTRRTILKMKLIIFKMAATRTLFFSPANTRHRPTVGQMLVHRLRR